MARSLEVKDFTKLASADRIIEITDKVRILIREKPDKCEG